MLAITKDGKRAYTSNVGSGTVTVLDLVHRKPVTVISVADVAQRISLSADDRWVFTADQKKPRLAVIDTKSNAVSSWVSLPSIGYGTAPTSDGKWLLVTMPSAGQVAVVDLEKMKVARTVAVSARPVEILLRPDQPIAYVSCMGAGEVADLLLVGNYFDFSLRTSRCSRPKSFSSRYGVRSKAAGTLISFSSSIRFSCRFMKRW